MTNVEARRNDKIRIIRSCRRPRLRHSGFISSFVIRHSSFHAEGAMTIIELLVVIIIIFILAGLVLSISSYVQNKGARARAETEIAAMSAALESYKADNGIYPRNSDTDGLDPTSDLDPTSGLDPTQPCSSTNKYTKAGLYLYEQISGDTDADRVGDAKSYFAFKPAMLLPPPPNTCPVIGIRDPFGNSYGYSTAYQAWVEAGSSGAQKGYNPTYDLWSTVGGTTTNDVVGWIKN